MLLSVGRLLLESSPFQEMHLKYVKFVTKNAVLHVSAMATLLQGDHNTKVFIQA
jgi:hypothetical protein